MVSAVGHVGIKGDEKVTGPRIFVNIASYRDPECQWTVKDLFDKAEHPERIFVGICWQCVPIEDDDCFRVETRPKQVRFKKFQAKDSRGVGWARHHSQSLWDGEEFTLQKLVNRSMDKYLKDEEYKKSIVEYDNLHISGSNF